MRITLHALLCHGSGAAGHVEVSTLPGCVAKVDQNLGWFGDHRLSCSEQIESHVRHLAQA